MMKKFKSISSRWIAVMTAVCILFTGIMGIYPVLAEETNLNDWSFLGEGSSVTGDAENGYTLDLKAGEFARFNIPVDIRAGMNFKISNPTVGKYIIVGFNGSKDITGTTVKGNFVGKAAYGLYPQSANIDVRFNWENNYNQPTSMGGVSSSPDEIHTFRISPNFHDGTRAALRFDGVILSKDAGLDGNSFNTVNNNGEGGYFTIYSEADVTLTNIKPVEDWALNAYASVSSNPNGGTDIKFNNTQHGAAVRYEKTINMTEGNGFIFKTSGNATYEITFEWGSKKTFADKTSWSDPKRRKIKLRFTDGNTVNACTVGDNNVENANTKVSQKIDYSDYCHVYFKDNFLYVNGKNVCNDSVGEKQKETAYVSIKTWSNNVSMIDFNVYSDDLRIDPEGILTDGVSDSKNDNGTYILTADTAEGSVEFDRYMVFNDNPKKLIFKETEYVVPETALNLSIVAKGDIKDKISIGAAGATPSMQLILKDKQTGDDTTTLSVGYYDDVEEKGTFDFEYIYGKNIYVWMRYGEDVNRWSFAVEQSDGLYKIYDTELYAYPEGATDYNTQKRLKLTFSNAGDKVTAAALYYTDLPCVKYTVEYDVMNSEEVNGELSLSHDGKSAYIFGDYINFTTTSIYFTSLLQRIPENVLKITLQPDSIPQDKYLGVRLFDETDVENSEFEPYTLRFKIMSDNGNGTGIIGVSSILSDNPEADYEETEYKWGDPIYLAPLYDEDVNRWLAAMPNPSGFGYKTFSNKLWHSDAAGVNPGKAVVPYCVGLIADGGVKNLTATIVKAENVIQNEEAPIPTDTGFVGNDFTENKDQNGSYGLKLGKGSSTYAKSTWQVDLTDGLLFRVNEFKNKNNWEWVSICLSGTYWQMPQGSLGTSSTPTLLLRENPTTGYLQVSFWNGSSELLIKTLTGISATGTHILSVKEYESEGYYVLTVDGQDVCVGYSIATNNFKKLNNYNEETGEFEGAFVKFSAYASGIEMDSIRAFETTEEKEMNGWLTNTNATVTEDSKENYTLDMTSFSSLLLQKMANLEKGITFKVKEAEKNSRFGLAFAMIKDSSLLSIPPAITTSDIYYNFADNGDGTVTIRESSGSVATIDMDITKEHKYSFEKIITEDGEEQYSLAIDGKAVFDKGLQFYKFMMLNNGSLGAFPVVFTESKIKITGFTGIFTTPVVSNDENLWDEDWEDDDWGDDDSWEDDDWGDADSWEDDDWGDADSWDDDDWSGDEWNDDDTVVEDTTENKTMYKKVLRRIKIERDPIIVEYSLWWLWVIISVVVVAGGTVAFIIIRKKRKASK